MENGNGQGEASAQTPAQLIERYYSALYEPRTVIEAEQKRPFLLSLTLFLVTIVSVLAVGREYAVSYAQNRAPFAGIENPFAPAWHTLTHPGLLLGGMSFAFTLIGILLAHELGHYFACRYYKINASYPYFLPAPTLIGTFGAFIRIRSPIFNRKALFDVGFSGPLAGFVLAVPILTYGIAISKVVANAQAGALVIFGNPPLVRFLLEIFHPGVNPKNILLSPIALAAWVGLFVTALNLLPIGQLDGGHIVYSIASGRFRRISITFGIALVAMGIFFWRGWLLFAVLLLFLGFRHPPLLDPWTPLDAKRRAWAVVALIIFLLCFTPLPFAIPH